MLFCRDGAESGDTIQHTADGEEERTKEDSGRPWRRPATVDWGGDES